MDNHSDNEKRLFTKLSMATLFVVLTPILLIISIAYDFIGVALAIIVTFNIAAIISYAAAFKRRKFPNL